MVKYVLNVVMHVKDVKLNMQMDMNNKDVPNVKQAILYQMKDIIVNTYLLMTVKQVTMNIQRMV